MGGISFTCGRWPFDPEKSTLIFIHGAASNNIFWNAQVEGLSEAFNTVAVDLPGHGASAGQGKSDIAGYADVVAEFMDVIQPPLPIPCGLSMGGAITQRLILDHPDRFSAGILINTGARLKVTPLIFELIEKKYADFVKSIFSMAISAKTDIKELRPEIEASTQCLPAIASGDFRACDGFDVTAELSRIEIPILVLAATDDKLTPVKYGIFLSDNIKNAELLTIRDAGHFSPMEKPHEVNRAIYDFLNRAIIQTVYMKEKDNRKNRN